MWGLSLFVPLLLECFCLLLYGFSFQGLGVGAHHYEQPYRHGYSSRVKENIIEDETEDVPEETVKVKCHATTVEVVIQPDLYSIGTTVDAADLRLGADPSPKESCKPTISEHGEYVIIAPLTDCGTKRLVTEESLIYVNLLVYSPSPSSSLGNILRMKEAVIPVECYYPRLFQVSSDEIKPDSKPFSARPFGDHLEFSLRLMSGDWQSKRASNQYTLGEYINIEASVRLHQPILVHLYIDNCVASPLPDSTSARYAFLGNDGCLFDALTGSRSMFLPRIQENKLRLQLESFSFYQQHKNTLYITCLLVAVPPSAYGEKNRRACSFIDGRWKSADGNDYDCLSCEQSLWVTHPLWSSTPVSKPPKGLGAKNRNRDHDSDVEESREWTTELTVGPLVLAKQDDGTADSLKPASRKRNGLTTDKEGGKETNPSVLPKGENTPLSLSM